MLVLTHVYGSVDPDEVRIVNKTVEQFLGMRLGYQLLYSVENVELLTHWKEHPNLVMFDYDCDVSFWETLNRTELFSNIPAKSRDDLFEMVPMCFPGEYVLITEIRLTSSMDYVADVIPFASIPVQGALLSDLRHLVMNSLDM